jgi:hypothetical protein
MFKAESIEILEKRNGKFFFLTVIPLVLNFIFGLQPILVFLFFLILLLIPISSLYNKQLFVNIKEGMPSWKLIRTLYGLSLIFYSVPIILCILYFLNIYSINPFR